MFEKSKQKKEILFVWLNFIIYGIPNAFLKENSIYNRNTWLLYFWFWLGH